MLDGVVGAMVGGFQSAGRLMSVVGAVMEAAVGEGAAEPLVEEQEEKRHLDPFRCEPVGVAGAVALQQPVAFELAQVVAELVQAVGTVGEVKAGENGAVDLFRASRTCPCSANERRSSTTRRISRSSTRNTYCSKA